MDISPQMIRILAVDDHPLLREGIGALIARQKDMRLVAEVANGREAVEQFRSHRPDVTLMDLQMPEMNGMDALIAIRGELFQTSPKRFEPEPNTQSRFILSERIASTLINRVQLRSTI